MNRIKPIYVCPDCEGHKVFSFAGRIIAKRCSECEHDRRQALTGADRIEPGIGADVRRAFERTLP